jgi:hypothetical protein
LPVLDPPEVFLSMCHVCPVFKMQLCTRCLLHMQGISEEVPVVALALGNECGVEVLPVVSRQAGRSGVLGEPGMPC